MATSLWTDRGGSGAVPLISMITVLGLLVASMVSFVLLMQGLGGLQITDVLRLVGGKGRKVIAEKERLRAKAAVSVPRRLGTAPKGLARPDRVIRHVGQPRCVTSAISSVCSVPRERATQCWISWPPSATRWWKARGWWSCTEPG
jgi:hypothetical protein